jgi:hypothetical protein
MLTIKRPVAHETFCQGVGSLGGVDFGGSAGFVEAFDFMSLISGPDGDIRGTAPGCPGRDASRVH